MFGEDVDLCWRAHLAGGAVASPRAVARHLEATSPRAPAACRSPGAAVASRAARGA